ncbi:MAG: hypothetical protein DWH81_12340 [Planctomycetota bacterium]|nr:MAG: hypothetical protein DWH81_12340 [Planctomycetota bacterium]
MSSGLLALVGFAGATAVAFVAAVPLARWMKKREVKQARESFRLQRESLEARFFDLAAQSGKPRGLRWVKCEWQPEVAWAREARTGLLTAFVSIELHFEAIEGGDMEDVAAVGTVRDACAVFHYQQGQWGTGGKALFNMNAGDAVSRLQGQFVAVGD